MGKLSHLTGNHHRPEAPNAPLTPFEAPIRRAAIEEVDMAVNIMGPVAVANQTRAALHETVSRPGTSWMGGVAANPEIAPDSSMQSEYGYDQEAA